MNETLRILLGLYLSTSLSSLCMNTYIDMKLHRDTKKESLKKLIYKKGLSSEAKQELSFIDKDHYRDMFSGYLYSIIPLYNLMITLSNIEFYNGRESYVQSAYDEIVYCANEIEDELRKDHVQMLKRFRESLLEIPSDLDLDDENTRLTISETKMILKKSKMDYKIMMKRFNKERDL